MVENREFPGCVAGLAVQGLVDDGLLVPCLTRMQDFFDRLANKSAHDEEIPLEAQPNPGLYALWGCLSDGQVLGLQRVGSSWRMTQIPIPSGLVRALHLPAVLDAKDKLAWIQIGPNHIDRFCQGRLIPVWESEISASFSPDPKMQLQAATAISLS